MLIPALILITFVAMLAASYSAAHRAQDLVPAMHSISTEARVNR